MIRKPTWILLILLALTIGAFFFFKDRPKGSGKPTETTQPITYLITDADGTLQSLQMTDPEGNKVRMQRDMSSKWIMTSPRTAEADQSQAGAAQIQIGALRIVAKLETPPDPNATQLANPVAIIETSFSTGKQHTLEVGGLTPTSNGYYVKFDGGKVYVVSQSAIEALLNFLKTPPYPATPTPEISETPSTEIPSPTP
jgi:hypothetical protein